MKKKILALCLVVAMAATAIVGASMAYLTDTDSDVNVMTLGNVSIVQHEYERVVDENGNYEKTTVTTKSGSTVDSYKVREFTQAKPLFPSVGEITGWDDTSVRWEQLTDSLLAVGGQRPFAGLNNVQDKFVLVENTGKTDAYVRTLIALEYGSNTKDIIGISTGDFWTWNGIGVVKINDNNYYVYEAIYKGADSRHVNGVLPAGEYTYNSLGQIYLKSETTNEDVEALDGNKNGTYDILVFSQAVQADGFSDAQTALDAAFGDITTTNHPWATTGVDIPTVVSTADDLIAALEAGEDVVLTEDVTAPLSQSAIYGTPVAVVQKNGGVIDGGGNSLDIENPQYNGYAIETYGGTIKNLTIDSTVGRGIVISSPDEDIYIDSVVINGPGYAINTSEHNGQNLIVSNSIINGWTSFAGLDSATWTNCTFGANTSKYWQNMGYDQDYDRLIRPYVNTTFTKCVFEKGFYIDLSALGADCTVTLQDCTSDGVELTADNYTGYITIELPEGRTLADCVIFK